MKNILKNKIILILAAIFSLGIMHAQEISCKKIFPMPTDVVAGKVYELPNNQYLIHKYNENPKIYDNNFNLLYEINGTFGSNTRINVFQNNIYIMSGSGYNIDIKLLDIPTNSITQTYTINRYDNYNDIIHTSSGIDNQGNYYVFTVDERYLGNSQYQYIHRLFKFNSQLSLQWEKNYNNIKSPSRLASFSKLLITNNVIQILGLVNSDRDFKFDGMYFSSSSGDRIFGFAVDTNNGNVLGHDYDNMWQNGQLENFYNTVIFEHNGSVYILSTDKTPSNVFYLGLRKSSYTSGLNISLIRKAKTTSNYIVSRGAYVINNQLIIAAQANSGTIQYWGGGDINNSYFDIIWLTTNISDLSNSNSYISPTNITQVISSGLQNINNQLGFLFNRTSDGMVTVDNQSLYMNDGDVAFAVFSNDTGYQDIDFYTQVTPNSSNPNNYLNQDKPIRFKVKVKNELSQNLASLSATISSSTPGVTITDNTANFASMLAGDVAWSSDEFEITVDPSVPDGTMLDFELSCNDPLVSGGPWISYFSFPIAPLQVNNLVLIDNQGDNDGIPEPGENDILLQPKIDNVSNNIMEQVRGILTCEDSFINITQDNYLYNVSNNIPQPVNPGDTDIVPSFPYKFNYPANEPLQELNFNLEIQANLDDGNGPLLKWQSSFTFNDGIEPPPSIVSTNPADDAIDVAVDTDLVINFDKPVSAVSGKNIYIYNNGTLENTIDVTGAQVSVANDIVTIDPTNDLQDGSDYFILIDAGAFVDNNSQEFAGIINPTVWNFSTLQNDPPQAPVLTANVISDSEVELSWNIVADANSYSVFSCDESITYASNLTTDNFTVTNLNSSTQYNFIVKSENDAGFSNPSNCVSVTTFCAPPWGSPVIYTSFTRAFCEVTIDGQPADDNDKVAAFVGNELRGIGDVFISNGTAYTVINIQGEVVETVNFEVWDTSSCSIIPVVYTTQTNPSGTIGAAPNYLPIAATTADTTPPVADNPNLPDITAECEVFIDQNDYPTATDNVDGTIVGVPDVTFPVTTQGTTVVTWAYTDSNNNTTTQTQNIIIDDVTPPVPDVANLPDINSECEVNSLTPPTATDNCAGSITATGNANLPISTQGTTVVTWTYNDGNGNTSTQTQNVIITPIDNSLTQNGNTLTANASGNYTYQWGDCANGGFNPIAGETNPSFTPAQTGDYAVEISNGDCSVTSDCIHVDVSGMSITEINGVKIYPNPTTGILNIQFDVVSLNNVIYVIDVNGKLLLNKTLPDRINKIDINNFARGMYIIKLVTKNKTHNMKIIKK